MNRTIRLPLVIIFLALLFFVPLMVQTVLSADPTPTPGVVDDGGDKEFPLVPTTMAPAPEMRTMAVEPNGGGSIPPTMIEIDISQTSENDFYPHVAYNTLDDNYLAVWQDNEEDGLTKLQGRYLDTNGRPLTSVFLIEGNLAGPVRAQVVFGGDSYLVLWREGEDHFAGSLQYKIVPGTAADPPLMEAEKTLIHEPVLEDFAAVYDESRQVFLAIWLDYRHPSLENLLRGEIFGRRISLSGSLLGNEINLVPFEQNPGGTEVEKILMAPSASGDLSIALNPLTDIYLISFSNYYCSNLNCLPGEDVQAARINAETLSLESPHIGITRNISKAQWQAQILYQPRMDEFLIVWSDNRTNEGGYDLVGIRLDRDGLPIHGSGFISLVQQPGSQEFPKVAAVPGEGDSPAFALVWQHQPADAATNQSYFLYLDELGSPMGEPLIPSFLVDRIRETPEVAIGAGTIPKILIVWKDYRRYHESNIHSRLLFADDYLGVKLQSPLNFTMVFSVLPTFTWGDVPDAVRYRFSIHDYLGVVDRESGQHRTLHANYTRDPDNPAIHSFKMWNEMEDDEYNPISIGSGKTLSEGAYFWRVQALDEEGNSLGVSLFGIFQIPPLGIPPEMPDFPDLDQYWNAYDDKIYHWSEVWDLPPNIFKAVLASESGNMHVWFGIDPEHGFLYEAKHDEKNCYPNGFPANNYCDEWDTYYDYFKDFFLENGAAPDIYPANNAYLQDHNPSIITMVGDSRVAGLSNWRAMAEYTGCIGFPDPSKSNSDDFFNCVYDWYDGRNKKAEYRVMSGYGLSGINYWTNVPLLYPKDPDHLLPFQQDPSVKYTPESLYTAELNIRLGTQILGNKRCWWQNAAHSRPPFEDPVSEAHEYLSAINYKEEDFEKWRQVIAAYAGYGFHYPMWYGSILQVGRVEWRFFGQDSNGNRYPGTYPVDLSGFNDLGIEVGVQIEDSPQQWSQDKIYGESTGDDTWDKKLKLCPYPGYFDDPDDPEPELSLAPAVRSLDTQSANGLVLGGQEVDFKNDGDPEWVQLIWEGDPETQLLHAALIRIYNDQTLQELIWESPLIDGVSQFGFGSVVENPVTGKQLYLVEFADSLHSYKIHFVGWDGFKFTFVPFSDPLGFSTSSPDHLVSTGGGAFFQPDGSIVLLNRGVIPAEQTDYTVYAPSGSGFYQERTYTYDSTVEDTTPPVTTALIEPLPNSAGWNTTSRVVLTAADDQGVAFLDYTLAGSSGGETQRSYLSQVWFPLDEGVWTLRYQATDIYDNLEIEGVIEIKVDKTPPATYVDLWGYPGPPSYLSHVLLVFQNVDRVLGDGSPGSGLARTEISLDEGISWNPVTSHVNISEVGEHIVWVRSEDNAGNLETPVIKTFEILPYSITLEAMIGPVADEGDILAIETSFTDIDHTASHTAKVHWFDGTPSTNAQVVEVGPGQYILQAEHVYLDNGLYPASWVVSNNKGEFVISYFPVTINNLPPEVEAGEDLNTVSGEEITLNGSFTDPGELDIHTITWNFGDGEDESGTLTPGHVYNNMGSYTVTLTVTDDDGGVGSDTLTVTVSNGPPQITLGGEAQINEGEQLTRAGSFTDPGSESWTGEVDYGEGAGFQALTLNPEGSFDLNHLYPDDGVFTVTVQITDELEAVGEASFQVIVNNIAPEVTLSGESSLSEGETFTGACSFIDPGADSWTATVDYDDGLGPQTLILTEQTFTLEHLYPEDGIPAVTVCVTDDDGGEGCAVLTLTVENLPPSVVAGGDMTAETGEVVTFSGSYSDPGVEDTHTISWDFGDGETEGGTLTPTHVYPTPGTYTVTLTVTDDEGAAGSDSLSVVVTQSQPEDLIVLNDWRSDNCLELDLDTGDYSWYADNGEVYTGSTNLVERGQVVLFRSIQGDPQYLRGLLLLRPEMGTARMRVGGWFRGGWMFILDRDFTEPTVCQ